MSLISSSQHRGLGFVVIGALSLIFSVPSVGLQTASMKLPPEFAAAALRLPVDGYGGANRGQFTVGGYSGEFTRTESRLAIFDPLHVSNRGTASFVMRGPGIADSAGADCTFRENVVTVGVVTFDPKKLVFVCEFAGSGIAFSGRLTLGEPRPKGLMQRVIARASRRGLAEFGSTQIEIESVHDYQGSRLQAPTPVGYLLTSESRVIGALELTDVNPTVFLAEGLSEHMSRSALMAAIAVSLLRDPAESTLGD